ncbi:MAG: hypothetical protein V3V09_03850 [Arenicellales bacterium]
MKRRNFIQRASLGAVWVAPVVQAVSLPLHARASYPCRSEPPFGLQITVIDFDSGVNIACLASGTMMDGTYSETFRHHHPFSRRTLPCDSPILGGALNRAGVYNITIDAPEYQPYFVKNIEVKANNCNTDIVRFTVKLKKA